VQRTPNDDGLCISWLWENLKRNTKVVVWDDDGREIPIPADDTPLYYNPNGGTSYHASANCRSVRDKYLPLTAFAYGDLDGKFKKLTPCPHCVPAQRKSVIEERNAENLEIAQHYQNPILTGEEIAPSVNNGAQEEATEGVVTIVIR